MHRPPEDTAGNRALALLARMADAGALSSLPQDMAAEARMLAALAAPCPVPCDQLTYDGRSLEDANVTEWSFTPSATCGRVLQLRLRWDRRTEAFSATVLDPDGAVKIGNAAHLTALVKMLPDRELDHVLDRRYLQMLWLDRPWHISLDGHLVPSPLPAFLAAG